MLLGNQFSGCQWIRIGAANKTTIPKNSIQELQLLTIRYSAYHILRAVVDFSFAHVC